MSPELTAVPSSSSSFVNGLLLEELLDEVLDVEVDELLVVEEVELLDVSEVLEVVELLAELRMLVSEL